MRVVALIPARGGSKSIPFKNTKKINGRPLIYWTIDAAINCDLIDEVYISTDSDEIKKVVSMYDRDHHNKLFCIDRDAVTATDLASTESVMIDFVNRVQTDYIVLLQATSPLTEAEHIHGMLSMLQDHQVDSVMSAVRQKRFIWQENKDQGAVPINYSLDNRPRRQDFDGFLVENGAVYITKTSMLKQSGLRVSGNIKLYEMPEETYYELDEYYDWDIVGELLKKKRSSQLNFKNIKLFATDCDGVLTDAGMYYSPQGEELKKFNTKDGMGFKLLRDQGVITAILTGENTEIVTARANKLGIDHVYLGCSDKVKAMQQLLDLYQLEYENIAYIGDDINDIELLDRVGMSFAVQDAHESVKAVVKHVTKRNGGDGAVREAIDYLYSKGMIQNSIKEVREK